MMRGAENDRKADVIETQGKETWKSQ